MEPIKIPSLTKGTSFKLSMKLRIGFTKSSFRP